MRQLTLALAATLVLSLLAAGCGTTRGGQTVDASPDPPRPASGTITLPPESMAFVRVEPIEDETGSVSVRAPARVAFRDGAVSRVGSPMAGRVTAVRVRSGDRVRKGDALVTLVCPEAAAARTALATALAAQREAGAAYERETRMLEEGVGVERDRFAAEIRLAAARAEVDRAQATSALVGDGGGAELTLKAPIAGTVLSVRASQGAAVEAGGEPLIEVGDPAALWVVAEVPETDLPLVHEGAGVSIELNSLPGPLRARVLSVGTEVSDGLRTAPVRIELEGSPAKLCPGMFGRARIECASSGPTLPTEAVLIKDGRESVVYVETSDRTFERRVVSVGQPIEGHVPIHSGLTRGERVVTKGALLLDGAAEQLL